MITEYLTRWRNRIQDGKVEIREQLINLLDQISMQEGWFMPGQYEFLKVISHARPAAGLVEPQPSARPAGLPQGVASSRAFRNIFSSSVVEWFFTQLRNFSAHVTESLRVPSP